MSDFQVHHVFLAGVTRPKVADLLQSAKNTDQSHVALDGW